MPFSDSNMLTPATPARHASGIRINTDCKRGFSLVELSVVLVILALLIGGIIAGQSLIRAAELREVTAQYRAFETAVTDFKDKFHGLPGDLRNAEDFWGTMTSGACPAATGGTGTQTCNGNGNSAVDPAAAANQAGENYTFWQQLANAGLIEGRYNGLNGAGPSANSNANYGVNAPKSSMAGTGWTVRVIGPITRLSNLMFEGTYGNTFFFGGATINQPWDPPSPVISTAEAYSIDKKMDDGMPGYGVVRTIESNTECHDQSAGTAAGLPDIAKYNLSNVNDNACQLLFVSGF